ncbi:uncharacterized protein LOC126839286 [Adelges cooleyi]|uniref:uncharacterized protein LOC126839285 n=1 Tax=Adelges cooleyi TaxID=133065 RepID=UPI00217F726E|nr:uncharacterized protein LOC126839285 [Adelges cooleyi]XP_050430460.1 uncharacterized protein LOC126839286 [Adelges cooleyi]
MAPYYAVVFRQSRTGTVATNWPTAQKWRDSSINSFCKKFSTQEEAVKYLENLGHAVMYFNDDPPYSNSNKNKDFNVLKNYINEIDVTFKKMFQFTDQLKNQLSYTSKLQALNISVIEHLNGIVGELETSETTNSSTSNNKRKRENDRVLVDLDVAKKNLIYNSNNEVVCYIDGVLNPVENNHVLAVSGVYFADNHPYNLHSKVPSSQTLANAKIYGALLAICQVQQLGISKINIHTDSTFLVNCVTNYFTRWRCNGWLKKNKEPVKNQEMLKLLDSKLVLMKKVSWTITDENDTDEAYKLSAAKNLAQNGISNVLKYSKPK